MFNLIPKAVAGLDHQMFLAVLLAGLLVVAAVPVFSMPYPAGHPQSDRKERMLRVQNLLNEGISLYDNARFAEAIAVFDSVIRLEPKLVEGYYRRAVARREMRDLIGAIQDFDKALALDPVNARAFFGRGLAKQRNHDAGGAINDYSRAISLIRDFEIAYFNRGSLYYEARRNAEAVSDFDRVLAINPVNVPALNNRALARERLNDFSGAIGDYTRALKLDPGHEIARQNLDRLKASLVLKGGAPIDGIAIKSRHHKIDFRGVIWDWFDPRAEATVKATPDYVNISVRESHAVAPAVATPRVVTPVNGDFSLLIRVKADLANSGETAGLLAYGTQGAVIRLVLGEDENGGIVSLSVYDGDTEQQRVIRPAFANNLLLRLVRKGNRFSGWMCEDEMTWVKVGEIEIRLPYATLVGFDVVNSSGSRLFRAEFSQATFVADGP